MPKILNFNGGIYMEINEEILKQFQEKFKTCKTTDDLFGDGGPFKLLMKNALETMLSQEMTEHLGYEKHESKGKNSGNSRNGKSKKTLITKEGELEKHNHEPAGKQLWGSELNIRRWEWQCLCRGIFQHYLKFCRLLEKWKLNPVIHQYF